jgi:ABC-2 type transport system ATP-binding protein
MLLEIEHLTKTYRGGVRANDDVTLSVGAGEVYGLLGHNGAGKTTLASEVVGLVRPDAGAIRIGGLDAVARPAESRRRCSIQPQAQVPIAGLTPRQAIDLVGRLRGAATPEARRRSDRHDRARSRGMARRRWSPPVRRRETPGLVLHGRRGARPGGDPRRADQ